MCVCVGGGGGAGQGYRASRREGREVRVSDILYHPYSHSYIFIKVFWLIQLSHTMNIQSTLIILKSTGPSETLRDIRTSTYQI